MNTVTTLNNILNDQGIKVVHMGDPTLMDGSPNPDSEITIHTKHQAPFHLGPTHGRYAQRVLETLWKLICEKIDAGLEIDRDTSRECVCRAVATVYA